MRDRRHASLEVSLVSCSLVQSPVRVQDEPTVVFGETDTTTVASTSVQSLVDGGVGVGVSSAVESVGTPDLPHGT